MSEYPGFILVWDHNFLAGVTGCRKTWISVTCDRSVVSSGTPVSYTNKTDRHDITEILWKVALSTINKHSNVICQSWSFFYVQRFEVIVQFNV